MNFLLSDWGWLSPSTSTCAGLLWMSHWQIFPGARQLGTSFFCYSTLLMGCQFVSSWHNPWQCLQETRFFPSRNACTSAVKAQGCVPGLWNFGGFPTPCLLDICWFIQLTFIEPHNRLALCWVPEIQPWTRPKLCPHTIHRQFKRPL